MSLARRLLTFFLAMLAAVLIIFSAALWLFQRWMTLRHIDELLVGALQARVASIEIEPDGVEWNPSEHRFDDSLGNSGLVEWQVATVAGVVIDHSPDNAAVTMPAGEAGQGKFGTGTSADGTPWRVITDRVAVPPELAESRDRSPPDGEETPDAPEYPELWVTCAIPMNQAQESLRQLACALIILSAAVWGIAAIFSRRLVRRALRPMTAMAAAASRIDGAHAGVLPVSATGDEVEELGRSFNALLGRLQQALGRERRFTAEASHQLRTPLTILLGQLDVALRRERSVEEYRKTLRTVHHQGQRLRTIIDSLLSLARSETQPLRHERVEFDQWLPGYLESFSRHARWNDLTFESDHHQRVTVDVDAELLSQLLDILVENAFAHTPPGARVIVRIGRGESGAFVDVEDQGPGIPASDRDDLFRPFHRGQRAVENGVPGLGLGLALARRIAERLGAELDYRPATPRGSLFCIRFSGAGSVQPIDGRL